MRGYKKKNMILATFLIFTAVFCLPTAFSNPNPKKPIQIEADTITYDAKQDIIEAIGDVTITQGEAIITAERLAYNVKSKEGHMAGGVKALIEGSALTADKISSYDDNERILASGNVVVLKDMNRLTGAELEYYPSRQYALMPVLARIETKDAVMTADKVEAFLGEERAIGTGNVHVVSAVRAMDATADQAVYYGLPKENSKIILTGNARVLNEGNLLTGENLTISLSDENKRVDASGGRPRLLVIPQ